MIQRAWSNSSKLSEAWEGPGLVQGEHSWPSPPMIHGALLETSEPSGALEGLAGVEGFLTKPLNALEGLVYI